MLHVNEARPVQVNSFQTLKDSTSRSATRGRGRATRHAWSLIIHCNSTYRPLSKYTDFEIVPKLQSTQDTARQVKRLAKAKLNYIMLWFTMNNIVCRKGLLPVYVTLMFQKPWLKSLEESWSENTHNNTHTNPSIRWDLGEANSLKFSCGGPNHSGLPTTRVSLNGSIKNFSSIEKPSTRLIMNWKLFPHWTDKASVSYLGKLQKGYWRSHLIVKCNKVNLREIMTPVTV